MNKKTTTFIPAHHAVGGLLHQPRPQPRVRLRWTNLTTNAVQTARRLMALFKEDEASIKSRGRAASALRVFNALCERPVITLKKVCCRAGASFPTATKGMDALLSLGIAREATGHRRNRVFAYHHLDILNEGTEPL